jgi:hypothetical protein
MNNEISDSLEAISNLLYLLRATMRDPNHVAAAYLDVLMSAFGFLSPSRKIDPLLTPPA